MSYLFPSPAKPLRSLLDRAARMGEEFSEEEATLDLMLMMDRDDVKPERYLAKRWNWSPARVHRSKNGLREQAESWRRWETNTTLGLKQAEAEVKQAEAKSALFDSKNTTPEAEVKQAEARVKQYRPELDKTTELDTNPLPSARQKTERVRAKKKPGFVEPELEEVREVFTERATRSPGLFDPDLEAEKFHSYYTANGWRVGRNPMKSWPATITNWITNIRDRNGKQTSTARTTRPDAGRPSPPAVRGGGQYDYLLDASRGRAKNLDRGDGAGGDPAPVSASAPAPQLRRVV